jgi:hypothetical protein
MGLRVDPVTDGRRRQAHPETITQHFFCNLPEVLA